MKLPYAVVLSAHHDDPGEFMAKLTALMPEDEVVYPIEAHLLGLSDGQNALYVRFGGVIWRFIDRPLWQTLDIIVPTLKGWAQFIPSIYKEEVDPQFDLSLKERVKERFFKPYGTVIYVPHRDDVSSEMKNLLYGQREQFEGQTIDHPFTGDWDAWIAGLWKYPLFEQIRMFRVLVANDRTLKSQAELYIRPLLDLWRERDISGHYERLP